MLDPGHPHNIPIQPQSGEVAQGDLCREVTSEAKRGLGRHLSCRTQSIPASTSLRALPEPAMPAATASLSEMQTAGPHPQTQGIKGWVGSPVPCCNRPSQLPGSHGPGQGCLLRPGKHRRHWAHGQCGKQGGQVGGWRSGRCGLGGTGKR